MHSDLVVIDLHPEQFGQAETVLARHAGLTASVYRYRSGVCALRIANALGHISMLPFQGQQIWDAEFNERQLTMRSMFDEPLPTEDFLRTYGAFFVHCGATAMGDPGPEDKHPVHGELPNAHYQEAQLIVGRDKDGPFMGLSGSYHHRIAFGDHYVAQPTVTVDGGSSRIRLDMRIRNLRHLPMDLMYLAHTNFRPVDHAVLIDTVPPGAAHTRIKTSPSLQLAPSKEYQRLMSKLKNEPAIHRTIEPDQAIDPELVLALDPVADEDGWAHGMQILPDGSADFVSYRPDQLDHCLRWMTRTPDLDALGLMLPATAEADGYIAEKAKGNLRILPPQGEFRCNVEFGALDAPAAADLRGKIERLVQGR